MKNSKRTLILDRFNKVKTGGKIMPWWLKYFLQWIWYTFDFDFWTHSALPHPLTYLRFWGRVVVVCCMFGAIWWGLIVGTDALFHWEKPVASAIMSLIQKNSPSEQPVVKSAQTAPPSTHQTSTTGKPKVTPSTASAFIFGPWDPNKWTTTAVETEQLAMQSDVRNLAACENGQCHFSKLYSVLGVSDKWIAANANPDVMNITHAQSPTGFSFQDINFHTYVLNMYEPFIVGSQPGKIFMVDENGDLWYQPYSTISLITLAKAKGEQLPITIQENPELTGLPA